jgi:hypothetical protein
MQFFHRESFAQRPYELDEISPAVEYGVSVDENSPLAETEVRFNEDEADRHRSIHLDWHNSEMFQERELEIVCGYNPCRRELLNDAVKEISAVHGEIKILTVTMAVQNARCHALFFQEYGFKRVADRSRKTWSFSCDLKEHKIRKQHRKPRAKKIVNVQKPESAPAPELKFLLSVDELQAKQVELDELRLKIQKLERAISGS